MKRNENPGTQFDNNDEWKIEIGVGGNIVVKHPSGSEVIADVYVGEKDGRSAMRVNMYRHLMHDAFVTDGPAAPIDWIEEAINVPYRFKLIVETLFDAPPPEGEVVPMKLPEAMLRQRARPDAFYKHVAALVQYCKEHDIAFGPRIAKDNDVSENTVRYWIHEARKRGFLDGGTS